jgi:hypothetical protein
MAIERPDSSVGLVATTGWPGETHSVAIRSRLRGPLPSIKIGHNSPPGSYILAPEENSYDPVILRLRV